MSALGHPRIHFRVTGSTNAQARERASGGAPHGTLVTAGEQTAGRGRQGRSWTAPAGRALLCSLIVRPPNPLLPLLAGAAVAEVAGPTAQIKWPNDVLLDGRKVAGILVEGRPQEGWAVVGIGVNVAVRMDDLPQELRETAGTLGREPADVEAALDQLLVAFERGLAEPAGALERVRERDALRDQPVRWSGGAGVGAGIDAEGRLLVRTDAGELTELEAGEVHLGTGPERYG